MTEPIKTDAIAKGTARSWGAWRAFLDAQGARDMSHADIARMIVATGDANGWWAQGITVAYEQAIGRRKPGQVKGGGTFQTAASKTLPGSMEEVMARWRAFADTRRDWNGVAVEKGPEASDTQKWRYWRAWLSDGSRLVVTATDKGPGKATLTIAHENLGNGDAAARWRAFWKDALARLA